MKGRSNAFHFLIFTLLLFKYDEIYAKEKVRSLDNQGDEDDTDDGKEETLNIPEPVEPEANVTGCTRKQSHSMHEIRIASYGQYPFMAALMSPKHEYLCSGSIISNGIILTTAECTQSLSYVLINTTSDRKDNNSVSLHVTKSENFPSYVGPNTGKDVAIVYTDKYNNTIASKIALSNYTSSQNLNDIEVVGFGLNADSGQPKKLQFVGLEVRDKLYDNVKAFIDCIDTKVPTCFRDKGGPLIFNNELIGIVTKGEPACTGEILPTYALNKRMVDALPLYTFKAWLDEKIKKNFEPGLEVLETYPKTPSLREAVVHVMTSSANLKKYNLYFIFTVQYYIFKL